MSLRRCGTFGGAEGRGPEDGAGASALGGGEDDGGSLVGSIESPGTSSSLVGHWGGSGGGGSSGGSGAAGSCCGGCDGSSPSGRTMRVRNLAATCAARS